MMRTDLVVESFDVKELDQQGGIKQTEEELGQVKITRVTINGEKAALRTGKPQGEYVTVQVAPLGVTPSHTDEETLRIAKELEQLLPDRGDVLVAGLGNMSITPDAIGPMTCEKVIATRHFPAGFAQSMGLGTLRGVAVLAPGVLGQTGIETAEILKSICGQIRPSCVIAVDALAARDPERLGTTLQLSSTGISPGSGVQNRRKELSKETLGVPVIGLGVPTVIDLSTVAHKLSGGDVALDDRESSMMVTPRDVDLIVEHAAGLLGLVINKALQPQLDLEDIAALM